MKLSSCPTEYIIVRADTANEWVFPNAAIIKSNPKLPELGKRMVALLKDIENEGLNIYKIAFWDEVTFLKIDEEDETVEQDVIDFLEEEEGWGFAVMSEEEINNYKLPIEIDAQTMNIDTWNTVNWKGYSGGGDEYYTRDIDLLELEQAYQSIPDTPQDPVGNIIS